MPCTVQYLLNFVPFLCHLFECLQENTPKKGKGGKPKTPPTPKEALTVPEIQAKMMEAVKKVSLLMKPVISSFINTAMFMGLN